MLPITDDKKCLPDWIIIHIESEKFAADAEFALKNKELGLSSRLYKLAAQYEMNALSGICENKIRTFGIIAVSVVSLWLKAGYFECAKSLAEKYLMELDLPEFAIDQLKEFVK